MSLITRQPNLIETSTFDKLIFIDHKNAGNIINVNNIYKSIVTFIQEHYIIVFVAVCLSIFFYSRYQHKQEQAAKLREIMMYNKMYGAQVATMPYGMKTLPMPTGTVPPQQRPTVQPPQMYEKFTQSNSFGNPAIDSARNMRISNTSTAYYGGNITTDAHYDNYIVNNGGVANTAGTADSGATCSAMGNQPMNSYNVEPYGGSYSQFAIM
ncbi:MAG: hypothetical protein Faunusvirus10_8 [Faunusvirus sp.]|jgi:hypothetical protein|uniref:Uncharacterized protein n=1 Tax=Faunusvirus sp. TaxID=2487766 RepID=A0A3G4ZWT0_9VIRU|nr:MAG: hypothetical protein Faunusvirus10_8 [Faunusvirus sp.]